MSYTALARRYRSQSFDDVVGQEPIAQTLRNAIATDRLHHAYLFCGTRGVGKTSMARIFARALNAPDTITDCPKPAGVDYPDLDVQQRMADAIMRGDDINVIEIDGASNRSVEDARQLIANAGLAPSGNARFKVYIIDEVHMLTKDAFNTLLKLMEEPPSHLKFILATTEPHKVLPTIHSRCQRFDFRNIPTAKIVEHLRHVVKAEKLGAEDAVLFQVARLGNGSMRDALSLLDRLLATGQDPLTAEVLEHMLGLPDRQIVHALAEAIATSDVAQALAKTDELLNRGIAIEQLLTVMSDHFRNLMLIAACGADSELVELDDEARKSSAEQAKKFDTAALVHILSLLENVSRYARSSSTARALLDAAIVRLALSEKFADLAALVAGASGVPFGAAAEKKKLAPVSPPPPKPNAERARERSVGSAGSTSSPPPQPRQSPQAPPPPGRRRPMSPAQRDQVMNEPLIKQIVETFDARLIDVRAEDNGSKEEPTENGNE
ncbi:DNA polymerase III subunit gamma/tau [Planctomycetales bacterium ZRK34]|nr:DNA polymerase III subunit gamma/tau [Planctomycetales bacterium ZRK34]